MKVIQNLVPASKYNIKCPYPMTPEFIVVHNTANDASAANEVAYMIRNDNKVSFHYAIDDKEIVQGIPEVRNAWHAGDGANGQGNRKGIGIEICYSKSGGKRFEEAEKLAAKFTAYKLYEKGWGIDKVKKHQDFSGKYCPHRTLDMGWQRFLDMVQSELNALKGVDKVAEQNTPSSWAKEAWEWAIKEGITDGTNPKGAVTREQVVTMLYRFFQLLMKVLGK
ncbi:MAG: N-acetylmuramoyl-L-alanine amidase [Clostridium sp.]|nr:N-acetylmuramoyl-L-alanine amidase [Clostridium sp.]